MWECTKVRNVCKFNLFILKPIKIFILKIRNCWIEERIGVKHYKINYALKKKREEALYVEFAEQMELPNSSRLFKQTNVRRVFGMPKPSFRSKNNLNSTLASNSESLSLEI